MIFFLFLGPFISLLSLKTYLVSETQISTHAQFNIWFSFQVPWQVTCNVLEDINSLFQIVTIRLSYKLKWKESRMVVNESIDWSRGEINISPENIQVKVWHIIIVKHHKYWSKCTVRHLCENNTRLDYWRYTSMILPFSTDIDTMAMLELLNIEAVNNACPRLEGQTYGLWIFLWF